MKRRELLLISIGVFMTVITSLVIDIYNVRTRAQETERIAVLKTKSYKIDTDLLNLLESKAP